MPLYTTAGGVRRNIIGIPVGKDGTTVQLVRLLTEYQGVNRVIWEKPRPFEKMLFLMSEIPNTPVKVSFELPGRYRVTVIGNGGNGGVGGKKWGLYDGGGGGGGGSGGVFVMEADMRQGVHAYLEFARDYFYVPSANSIFCRFVDDNPAIQYPVFVTSSGGNGQEGQNAGFSTPRPDGGDGGAPGRTDYRVDISSASPWEFTTTTYGGWGAEGGHGYGDVDPDERAGKGYGAETPIDGYIYNGIAVGVPTWDGVSLHQNPYNHPPGWYQSQPFGNRDGQYDYNLPDPILGNGGAGGWQTINYGEIPPGVGSQGGVVIESIE